MDHYLDALETQLHRAAATAPATARPRPAAGRRRLRLALAGAALATVAAGVAVAVSGTGAETARAAALPVFERPATDISRRAGTLPPQLRDGMELQEARAFRTTRGVGYVLRSTDARTVCLVLPDPPAGFGATCAPAARVEREGLVGQLVAPAPDAGRSEVVVLPAAGARPPVLRSGTGDERALPVRDGVASATIERTGTLVVAADDGATRRIDVRPYEPQGRIFVECPGRGPVEVDSWRDTTEARRAAVCAATG